MPSAAARPLSETLKGYGRGIVGGLLFAIAPLYTMEIWWQGFIAPVEYLIVAVFATFGALVAYAHYAGIYGDDALHKNVLEALEILALGFLVAFVILKLVGQLPADLSFREALTRLTIEGLTSSIGVAVGSVQLGQNPDDGGGGGGASDERRGLIHEFAYSALGAMIIVAGFSPTMEIVQIGLETPPLAVLGTAVLSYLLALGVMSYFDFRGAQRMKDCIYAGGPLGDAFVTYAIALVGSALLLWTAGRFVDVGFAPCLYMTVYLALPATLGAAVGRLLL